jgi:hypothetical protein
MLLIIIKKVTLNLQWRHLKSSGRIKQLDIQFMEPLQIPNKIRFDIWTAGATLSNIA